MKTKDLFAQRHSDKRLSKSYQLRITSYKLWSFPFEVLISENGSKGKIEFKSENIRPVYTSVAEVRSRLEVTNEDKRPLRSKTFRQKTFKKLPVTNYQLQIVEFSF
jgi:hypothetical protein